MGSTSKVSAVELVSPPITTVANSVLMIPPLPSVSTANGSNAKLVVMAVIRMGRSRTHAPETSAS